MGMGYGANYVDEIDAQLIKKICPKEYKTYFLLSSKLIDRDYDLRALFNLLQWAEQSGNEDDAALEQDFQLAYQALCVAFKKKTKLEVSVFFHDSAEQGDRYDDLDGFVWIVNNAYEMTKPAKKQKKYIQRKFFVTYG